MGIMDTQNVSTTQSILSVHYSHRKEEMGFLFVYGRNKGINKGAVWIRIEL